MKLDTNDMDLAFTVLELDNGLILINTKAIGDEVAQDYFDEDEIYESSIMDDIQQYLVDTLCLCTDEAIKVLNNNNIHEII